MNLPRGMSILSGAIMVGLFLWCTPSEDNIEKPEYNGVWILSNYIDTIIRNRDIVKFTMEPLVWSSIGMIIENDTISSRGSFSFRINTNHVETDSFLVRNIYTEADSIGLKYSKVDDKIYVVRRGFRSEKKYLFIYRRATKDELILFNDFKNGDNFGHFERFLQDLFSDRIFVGSYRSLNEKNRTIEFRDDNTVVGFSGYQSFEVDIHFGTYHPEGNNNIILLRILQNESRRVNTTCYRWEFKKDTLVLNQMIIDATGDLLVPTSKYEYFIKI